MTRVQYRACNADRHVAHGHTCHYMDHVCKYTRAHVWVRLTHFLSHWLVRKLMSQIDSLSLILSHSLTHNEIHGLMSHFLTHNEIHGLMSHSLTHNEILQTKREFIA